MHKFTFSPLALFCLSFFSVNQTLAAVPIDLKTKPAGFVQSLADNVKQISQATDFNHTTHIRFQQTYAGYPVWGADGVLHIPNANKHVSLQTANANSTMNGRLFQNIKDDLGSKPVFSNTTPVDKLVEHVISSYLKKHNISSPISEKKIDRIVYVDTNNKAHWAFHISFFAKLPLNTLTRPNLIVDAMTFEIYKEWDNLQSLEDTLAGGFGGNGKVGQFIYDGTQSNYPALNITRDPATKTCYFQNKQITLLDNKGSVDRIARFQCPTTDSQHNNLYWHGSDDAANGAYSPDDDALYSGTTISNMYRDWYNMSPLVENGQPMMLVVRLHLEGYDNAFWDNGRITLGDGYTDSYPWVSLGVIAHESAHGFTEQHSQLIYDGQSGGLNESFSDMASAAVDYYVSRQNNWKIAYEILKDPNQALRYMDEPTKDCQQVPAGTMCSISNANNYSDLLDVHYTSGVFNKFFYLLATSNNWNTKKAFDIMLQANLYYWTSSSTFAEAACGVLSGANDYGYDKDTVVAAASAVGLDVEHC